MGSDTEEEMEWRGPGRNSKNVVSGFTWDPKEGRIKNADGSDIVSAEEQRDRAAVQVAVDVFAGTQSMGPVYRQRKAVEYIPLNKKEALYSAAQRKMVKNIPFDIMEDTAEQILAIVVMEVLMRKPGVKRIRIGEVWLSPPCNTSCKLDSINKEHKCRHGPKRKPIKGTEKGDRAKEADKMMAKNLALITVLGHMKERQRLTEQMQKVEGVELDMRGMEWFMENSEGMLAMQEYMVLFLETHKHPVERRKVDYCTWGHFYMKPTHVWTSMVHWTPKGTQEGDTCLCRGRCPFGSIGERGKWAHDHKTGQKSHQLVGGRGRKSNKGAVPLGLHTGRELCRVMQAKCRKQKK